MRFGQTDRKLAKKGPVDPWFFELGKRPDTREVAEKPKMEVKSPYTEPKPQEQENIPKDFGWSDIGKWIREHPMYGAPKEVGQWQGRKGNPVGP